MTIIIPYGESNAATFKALKKLKVGDIAILKGHTRPVARAFIPRLIDSIRKRAYLLFPKPFETWIKRTA